MILLDPVTTWIVVAILVLVAASLVTILDVWLRFRNRR